MLNQSANENGRHDRDPQTKRRENTDRVWDEIIEEIGAPVAETPVGLLFDVVDVAANLIWFVKNEASTLQSREASGPEETDLMRLMELSIYYKQLSKIHNWCQYLLVTETPEDDDDDA